MRQYRHWQVVLAMAAFACGCGKGEYEQLVKARIAQANQPIGGPRQRYNGDSFAFVAEFPGVPSPGANNSPTSESVESVVDGVRYTLTANRANAAVPPDQLLSAIVDTFVQQGYSETTGRENVDVSGERCRRAEMTNDAEGLRVRLQACSVDLDGYLMSALGAELNDDIVDDFFDSFVP